MRHVVLLRGVNLGSHNRLSMPELRRVLAEAGFDEVETYLQSGNAVVGSAAGPARVAAQVEHLLGDAFGLEVPVVVRTRDELAAVVARNPLAGVADNPKRYQVSFLSGGLDAAAVRRLAGLAAGAERVVAHGRELYAWHPDGVGRSRLAAALARPAPGLTATARNWATVSALLALAKR